MHQAGHPGGTHSDPQQWTPEHGKSHHKESDSSSEGDSSDDDKSKSKSKKPKPASKPVTFDDIAIAGYGGMPPLGQMNVSPAPPQPSPSGQAPDVKFGELSALDEATCRDAVLHFAAENCCFGKAPAQEMKFCKLTSHTALHYTLETFGEARSTGFKVEPFRGGAVDGPENGPAPPPWAVPCEPGGLFKDQVKLIEVPHTSVIKNCHQCQSQGCVKCARCKGKGKVKCKMCHGKGTREVLDAEGNTCEADCPFCKKGKISCHKCGGDGKITCPTCQGFRQVRCFIEVKVEFKNHMNEYILEQTDLPDKLLKTVSGKPILEQTLPQVWPITTYPTQEVNSNSQSLINSHRSNFNNERKLMQRQILRAVPVMEVVWDWKDTKDRRLWVYGNEHKVHCPDYPQRCCWGCQLL